MSGFGAMFHGAGPVGAGIAASGAGISPVIKNFIPERNEEIDFNEPIQFDIVDMDDASFDIIALGASFQNGDGSESVDLVHDDHDFRGKYTSSTRTSIPGGYRYILNREDGWPSTPTIEYFVVDLDQLEAEIDDS